MSRPPSSPAGRSRGDTRTSRQDDPPRDSDRLLGERHMDESEELGEATPLLSRSEDAEAAGGVQGVSQPPSPSHSLARQGSSKQGHLRQRWPTILALSVLGSAMLLVMAFGFAVPAVVQEYAQEAAVFQPTNLSIDSFTPRGVNARVQGDFYLESSKVRKQAVRDLGRAALWIAAAVEVKPLEAEAILPEYGDVLLASADIPNIVLSTRDGAVTHLDFVCGLESGDLEAIRRIADDWTQGSLGSLRVQARSKVALKSGIFSLGTKAVSQDLVLEGSMLPSTPSYDIEKLKIYEATEPSLPGGLHADVEIAIPNPYPLTFVIPPLNFDVLVRGCSTAANNILVANASTEAIQVRPKATLSISARATIRQLPDTLISTCPESEFSPLDALLSRYMHGAETTILVQGSPSPTGSTPQWLSELMASIVVPVPITGRSFESLIEDFSMTQVHLSMPNPLAEPDSPQAKPRISAVVRVQARLPQEINFSIDVPHVRANTDVFFKGKKLGRLDLYRWQNASSQIDAHKTAHPKIIIESAIEEAPLNVTDNSVLSEVVRDMFFGHGDVMLDVDASVDAEISTVLGAIVVRGIPASGTVPVRPLSGHQLSDLDLRIGALDIVKTTEHSISLKAHVNFTNPTKYTASVPYANVNLSWKNQTLLGQAAVQDIEIRPGHNENIRVHAVWDPLRLGGHDGAKRSRELLSRYVSGYNTTLTLTTHSDSIPWCPALGEALASFPVDIPAPSLSLPYDPNRPHPPNGDGFHVIDDATMHLLSSTVTLTLLNPLGVAIHLMHINATAFYNHTEPVGHVLYELPFAVPSGAATTPRLPVDWSLTGVGFNAVKDALGGSLKLDTVAHVGVRIGQWEEGIWYTGSGIGAHIEL